MAYPIQTKDLFIPNSEELCKGIILSFSVWCFCTHLTQLHLGSYTYLYFQSGNPHQHVLSQLKNKKLSHHCKIEIKFKRTNEIVKTITVNEN